MSTILRDKDHVIEISMRENDRPDWSNDFFNVGSLPHNSDGSYAVEDVYYCREQAIDWENNEGDYYGDETPSDNKCVWCVDLDGPSDLDY